MQQIQVCLLGAYPIVLSYNIPLSLLGPYQDYCDQSGCYCGLIVTVPLRNKPAVGLIVSCDAHNNLPGAKCTWHEAITTTSSGVSKQKTYTLKCASDVKFGISLMDKKLMPWLLKNCLVEPHEYVRMKYGFFISAPKLLQSLYENNIGTNDLELKLWVQDTSLPDLSLEQQKVVNKIYTSDKPILIYGVTGSGKTEVYFHLIHKICAEYNEKSMLDTARDLHQKNFQHISLGHLNSERKDINENITGEQILILVPEIALVNQVVSRFAQRFGFKPDIWHSQVSIKKKKELTLKLVTGSRAVVVGTRSAIFLPYKNLLAIIMDEEHDDSYKQEDQVLYDARHVLNGIQTVFNASANSVKICMFSATPSLDSIMKAKSGLYSFAQLSARHLDVPMPKIVPIDMRATKHSTIISRDLVAEISAHLERGEQVMLYLNKRGYYRYIICVVCNVRLECINCSAFLTFHQDCKIFMCHYCGYKVKSHPSCNTCGNELKMTGIGAEQLKELAETMFPQARTILISSDTMKTTEDIDTNLEFIKSKECNLIITTQILAKGHHFPGVNLIGILDIDSSLNAVDLYAFEKNFQLLSQISGRAGRAGQGLVMIQTRMVHHTLIQTLVHNDFIKFARVEMEHRLKNFMPPATQSICIIAASEDKLQCESWIRLIKTLLSYIQSNLALRREIFPSMDVKIFGPAPFTVMRLKRKYRYKIIVIAEEINFLKLQRLVNTLVDFCFNPKGYEDADAKLNNSAPLDAGPLAHMPCYIGIVRDLQLDPAQMAQLRNDKDLVVKFDIDPRSFV